MSFGGQAVLRGLSLELKAGSLAALIGPSGAGKSTLLKIMGGVLTPDSGELAAIDGGSLPEVGLMFQEGALFDSLSVFDNVAFPLVDGRVPVSLNGKQKVAAVREQVQNILRHVGLERAAFKMPAQLSGGMRRRASLARALVERPKVLLLDDPTAGLDPVASSVIMELIASLHKEYRPATIIASHDLRRLLPVVDRIIGIFGGQLVFDGSLQTLAGEQASDLYKFAACRYDFGESDFGEAG